MTDISGGITCLNPYVIIIHFLASSLYACFNGNKINKKMYIRHTTADLAKWKVVFDGHEATRSGRNNKIRKTSLTLFFNELKSNYF